MGRRIRFDWRKDGLRLILIIIGIAVGVCLIKVLIWEHYYYLEKEGSERSTAISSPTTEENLDETEISDAELNNYTVAPDRPRYLSIEKLGIKDARILPIGLSSSKQLQTPNNIFDVGWYTESGLPGEGGTMVMDGHNGGPTKTGVFKYLPGLAEGDIINVERGDGKNFSYSVVENVAYPLDQANTNMNSAFTSPVSGKESITLITCSGEWSDIQKTYLSRQFVKAVLLEQ